MAVRGGGQLVVDGLVFAIDFGSDRSWVSGSSTVYDISGKNNNSSFVTASAYTGSFHGGMVFNGTATRVDFGSPADLQPDNVTVMAVAKYVTSSQTVAFVGGFGNTGYDGYWVGLSGGNFRIMCGTGGINSYVSGSATSPQIYAGDVDQNLHVFAGTFDGSTLNTYRDGAFVTSSLPYYVSGAISYSGLSAGFVMGNVQGLSATRYWRGEVYQYLVYNRVLSETEILQNYNAIKGRFF